MNDTPLQSSFLQSSFKHNLYKRINNQSGKILINPNYLIAKTVIASRAKQSHNSTKSCDCFGYSSLAMTINKKKNG